MKSTAEAFKEMMKEKGVSIPTITPQEREQMMVDDFNGSEGTLTEYECTKCKNKGLIMKLQFSELYNDYTRVCEPCTCMEVRRTIAKAKNSGLGDYIKKRFDDYVVTDDWQKSVKDKAIEYVKQDDDSWFIALGQSGSGKTLISCIISNYFLFKKQRIVKYITWTDFISKLKRDMMSDNTMEVSDYLEDIKRVDILYIDELLKKYTEADLKYIIEIINYRYTNNLKTIISSERLVDELLDIDEATMGRMIEKADKYIINIAKDRKKNYRLKNIL